MLIAEIHLTMADLLNGAKLGFLCGLYFVLIVAVLLIGLLVVLLTNSFRANRKAADILRRLERGDDDEPGVADAGKK